MSWLRHRGHDEVVRELLNRGAETELFELGGLQPVSAAAKNGNVTAVLDLLEGGARFLSDEVVGGNLLRRAASRGDVEALKALLDRGGEFFDIDDKDNQGLDATDVSGFVPARCRGKGAPGSGSGRQRDRSSHIRRMAVVAGGAGR